MIKKQLEKNYKTFDKFGINVDLPKFLDAKNVASYGSLISQIMYWNFKVDPFEDCKSPVEFSTEEWEFLHENLGAFFDELKEKAPSPSDYIMVADQKDLLVRQLDKLVEFYDPVTETFEIIMQKIFSALRDTQVYAPHQPAGTAVKDVVTFLENFPVYDYCEPEEEEEEEIVEYIPLGDAFVSNIDCKIYDTDDLSELSIDYLKGKWTIKACCSIDCSFDMKNYNCFGGQIGFIGNDKLEYITVVDAMGNIAQD